MSRLLAALVACAVSVAACGDDDEDEGRSVTVAAGDEVRVVADEYSFDPSQIVIDGGGGRTAVDFTVDNEGSLAHDLKVLDGDRQLGGTPIFQGGESNSASVTLAPGEYRYVCTVGDHQELGMRGRLVVR